jgi:hypothetical protein
MPDAADPAKQEQYQKIKEFGYSDCAQKTPHPILIIYPYVYLNYEY